MDKKEPFEISQQYSIVQPNPDRAYPILCLEWKYLKDRISNINGKIDFYHTFGSILLGAAASTLIAIFSGGFPEGTQNAPPTKLIVAWACVVACAVIGVVCMFFASEKRKVRAIKASDVLTHMEVIEKRFDQSKE